MGQVRIERRGENGTTTGKGLVRQIRHVDIEVKQSGVRRSTKTKIDASIIVSQIMVVCDLAAVQIEDMLAPRDAYEAPRATKVIEVVDGFEYEPVEAVETVHEAYNSKSDPAYCKSRALRAVVLWG